MPKDRYMKAVVTVIAIALSVIAVNGWISSHHRFPVMHPQVAIAEESPRESFPRAWGKVMGYSQWVLVFEAPDGTIRLVTTRGAREVYAFSRK